jgi:GMP synthase-like glutamine amidotransferase
MRRKVLFIVNDPVANEGLLRDAFVDNGFDAETFEVVPWSRVDEPAMDVMFPDFADYDVIVALGARWPVSDEALRRSWAGEEMRLLRRADDAGVAVLGVCFGGQLLAAAHGGSVTRSPTPELGWCNLDTDDPQLVPGGPWFQWHFDRFEPPPGAIEVSRNPHASQAFLLGRNLGLQFHPELDSELMKSWIADDRDSDGDIAKLGVDEAELLTLTAELQDDAARRVGQLVRGFIARVGV